MASSFQEKNKQRNQQIIELLKQGLPHKEIAMRLGVNRASIYGVGLKAGIKVSFLSTKIAERNRQIIELLKQGLTYREIAMRFGVNRASISLIGKKAGLSKRVRRK